MVDIKTIALNINTKALGGAKIPHSVSNLVLRVINDSLYIAAFVYTFNRVNLQQNKMPRPIHWIIANIDTGEVINEYDCRKNDFSCADFDVLYDFSNQNVIKSSREDIMNIYALLDSVRVEYLNNGKLDIKTYRCYLDRILEITPPGYRRFYQELSNL